MFTNTCIFELFEIVINAFEQQKQNILYLWLRVLFASLSFCILLLFP